MKYPHSKVNTNENNRMFYRPLQKDYLHMKFYSTNNKTLEVSFKDAVFNSLPADKGLYMPEEIPQLDPLFIKNIQQ